MEALHPQHVSNALYGISGLFDESEPSTVIIYRYLKSHFNRAVAVDNIHCICLYSNNHINVYVYTVNDDDDNDDGDDSYDDDDNDDDGDDDDDDDDDDDADDDDDDIRFCLAC